MKTFIQLENVSKVYRTGNTEFAALSNVNINIGQGQNVAVIGKSGSGKSTFLNMITGIDYPSAGRINISNQEINKLKEKDLTKWRGQNIGIVFQFFQLLPTISVIDNLILAADFVKKIPKSKRKARARDLLELIGIGEQANKYPGELSGGEQQRAAIGRALVNDPDLVVADEPTGNLDSVNTQLVKDIFQTLNKRGKTILTVTHEQIDPTKYDKIIRLNDGKILEA